MNIRMQCLAMVIGLMVLSKCFAQERNVLACIDQIAMPDFGPGFVDMYVDELIVSVTFRVAPNGSAHLTDKAAKALPKFATSIESIVRGYVERGRFRRECAGQALNLRYVFRKGIVTGRRREGFATWGFVAPNTIELRYSLY